MSQSEIPNIDELLNSFIDGELDQRHQTEVQRLLKHDKQIAERLLVLQKCRRLVSSLPYTEAPQQLSANIKASLSRRQAELEESRASAQPAGRQQRHREHKGARHLFFRKLSAAAAMIALVAVLAAVIYSILAPEVTTYKPVAVEQRQPELTATVAKAEKPIETGPAGMEFIGKLELKTDSLPEVVAFINKTIEYNIPSDQQTTAAISKLRESHILSCSRQTLKLLLADLGAIWNKFDSTTLFIETGRPEGQIVVDAVEAEQIIEIVNRDNFETRIKTAKYFAALNNMTKLSPGKEVFAAIDKSSTDLITIPKPVLTSNEKPVTKAADEAEQKVLLTIVVVGSE